MHNSSIRNRLERLEGSLSKKQAKPYREAFWEMGLFDSPERHLELVSGSDEGRCWFREVPGPGPQLADFGDFDAVLVLTPAEMEA